MTKPKQRVAPDCLQNSENVATSWNNMNKSQEGLSSEERECLNQMLCRLIQQIKMHFFSYVKLWPAGGTSERNQGTSKVIEDFSFFTIYIQYLLRQTASPTSPAVSIWGLWMSKIWWKSLWEINFRGKLVDGRSNTAIPRPTLLEK